MAQMDSAFCSNLPFLDFPSHCLFLFRYRYLIFFTMVANSNVMARCSFDLNDDVPRVIYVPEKTYLCRWDTGCVAESDRSLDIPSTEDGSSGGSFSSSRSRSLVGDSQPPKTPTRTFDAPKPTQSSSSKIAGATKVRKHLEASLQTGIDIGSIRLQPVEFHQPQSPSSHSAAQQKPVLLASCSTLSDIVLKRRRPVADDARSLSSSAATKDNQLTAVFCIRRPGCGSCREHGMQLAQLTQQLAQGKDGIQVNLFGIIKETAKGGQEKNDALLSDFYSNYFPYPLYQDKEWNAFRFLGDRKVSVWKLLQAVPKMAQRYHEKNIENIPFGGDIFTQGGVLLFDGAGQLKYVYYERYGDELDMEALRWAMQDIAASTAPTSTSTKATRKPKRHSTNSSRISSAVTASISSLSSAPQLPARRRSLNRLTPNAERAPRQPRRCRESSWC